MRIRITLAALFLCVLPTAAHADPFVVTSGHFTGTGHSSGSSSIAVTGQNFSFSGFTANATHVQNGGLFAGGTTRTIGGTQFFNETNSVCFDGTCVSHDGLLDPDGVGARFTFSAGTFNFPDFGPNFPSTFTFTVPFTMTGQVTVSPSNAPGAILLVVGQGEMTFTYLPFFHNGQTHYEFRRVEATFNTPTPEPATLLLLTSGLAGAAALRRRRRG
ncbi:MAG TPA: PEP-CTERM sorting domain-containing protein [Pyrinomonadaceae bacterium]|nr:PEP-CTERM sorting domain-containing protein [Pyrinomonadaceae bacterium]